MPTSTTPAATFWSSITSRSRSKKFKYSLAGSVHDALWMLTTQWRNGEFKGDDNGSLIFTKTNVETTRLNRYSDIQGNVKAYNDSLPLECRIEQETIVFDLSLRIQMGKHWFKLLKFHDCSSTYAADFCRVFEISQPSSPEEKSNKDADMLRSALKARAFDGSDLYLFLVSGGGKNASQLNSHMFTSGGFVSGDIPLINLAISDFIAYYKHLFDQPSDPEENSWMPDRLEYQARLSAPDNDQSLPSQRVLVATEYNGGKLDWHAFDEEPENSPQSHLYEGSGEVVNDNIIENFKLTHIPTPVEFAGMPTARKWEMQNATHNYAALQNEKTDVLGILVKDFITTYNNNWHIIPFSVPVGSLSRVKSIVGKDTFGDQVYLGGELSNVSSQPWSMFTLNVRGDLSKHGDQLFMPPSLPDIIESEPIEKINFIRDQMANMAWAIELVIPNELAGGKDGYTASKELRDYLRSLFPEEPDQTGGYVIETGNPPYGDPGESYAMLKFKLLTDVPENWIPFVPRHLPGSDSAIQLQRATFPRILHNRLVDDSDISLIKPRGLILRYGLDEIPAKPYFVFEEEVPRSGTIITRNYQRARWSDGKTHLWVARAKTTGKGEGLSGLRFDTVTGDTLVNP